MKSTEEYISDYLDNYTSILKQGELWRMGPTLNEFIKKIDEIRERGKDDRKRNYKNEYTIQSNQDGAISVLFMSLRIWSFEEQKAQFDRLRKDADESRKKEIPLIEEEIKQFRAPLKFRDIKIIYKWLFYKQITLDMLPYEVLNEFKETSQYQTIIKRLNKESTKLI